MSVSDLVTERITITEDFANKAYTLLLKQLNDLLATAAEVSPVIDTVNYNWPVPNIDTNIQGLRPVPPDSSLLNDIVLPDVPDIPEISLEFQEPPYQSDLLDATRVELQDVVTNGGTGLSPAVEQAMQDRATFRVNAASAKVYDEAV